VHPHVLAVNITFYYDNVMIIMNLNILF
jgi:hypothetical protein